MSEPETVVGACHRQNTDIRIRAAKLATALRASGVKAGDAVALIARNDFVCIETALATQQLDSFAVPVNWHWQPPEIAHVLKDSGAKLILAHHEYLPMLRSVIAKHLTSDVRVVAVRPSWAPDSRVPPGLADIADYDAWIDAQAPAESRGAGRGSSMIYTSGTTGRPKAVRRLPANDAEVQQRRELLELVYHAQPGKVALVTGPLYHLFSLAVAMANFGAGASVIIMQRFDAEEFLRLVERHRVTTAGLVPTMFVRLLRLADEVRKHYDTSSLEFAAHTAAPCPPEIKRSMIDWWGRILHENYGCSETGVVTLISSEEWLAKPGSVGRPALSGEVRIYGEDGRRLEPRKVGDVYLKMHGSPDFTYHGDDEARAKVGRDGLVAPGDIGYLDEDGYLFLCDRRTEMLISGGVNIYPQEIEGALLSHPEIVDAAVFGIPDADLGEVAAAHIQRLAGSMLDAQAVLSFLTPRIAKYKLPRRIVFETALPRQENGKIYKRSLREPYWAGHERRI